MSAELPMVLPVAFQVWPPVLQGAALFFSTFVLEDVAAVAAGLLLATGVLAWPVALSACFLGIWMGDAGLYGFARVFGRSWFERSSLARFSGRVQISEQWFARRGISILIFSRLLPGARLPTYLAAGFLRLPMNRFLFITGLASLFWTVLVLFVVQVLGARVLFWLGPFRKAGWLLLFGIPCAFLLSHLVKRLDPVPTLKRLQARIVKWSHWEFWPAWMFYLPVVLYYLWLSLKYRSLTLPTTANPGIFSGGIVGESKIAMLDRLGKVCPQFTAEAELISGSSVEERLVSIARICQQRNIQYPFILKPDVGQRGAGVKLIRNEEQAIAYLRFTGAPVLLQRYAPGPHEVGIFYFRFPFQTRGHIFSITEKIFPTITGDGRSTVCELIWADPRAKLIAAKYLQRFKGREHEVLAAGQSLRLVEAGNHAQGCIFKDGMRFCTPNLTNRIDTISQKIRGFYIGRYDIRYSCEAGLTAGTNFQIVELNGAASEATSIYDSRNSLFNAYRTLFRQWELVFAIGAANRALGARPTPLPMLWSKWREYQRLASSYPSAD